MLRLDAALKGLPIRTFEPGETIIEAGETSDIGFIVISGIVVVYSVDSKGTERRILSTQKYETMPSNWLFNPSAPITYNYRALDKVVCVVIDQIKFQNTLASNPTAMFDLLLIQDRHIEFAKNRIEMLVQARAENKVLYMMRYLVTRFGTITKDLDWLDIPVELAQVEMADSLGLTRETTARSIKKIGKKGVVKTVGRKHYRVNITKMKELTY